LQDNVQVDFGHKASDENDQDNQNNSGNAGGRSNQEGDTRRPFDILKNLDLH